jgi:ElaB/YqjD/DUF883 family membrane-anchored ribosome-binding protein
MTTQTLKSTDSPAQAIAHAASDVKSAAAGALGTVAKAFSQSKDNCVAQFADSRDAVTGYARENPFRTMGVAALAGIVLGLFLFRR